MAQKIISEDHHPTLRHEDRRAIGNELQAVLVTLTEGVATLAFRNRRTHGLLRL